MGDLHQDQKTLDHRHPRVQADRTRSVCKDPEGLVGFETSVADCQCQDQDGKIQDIGSSESCGINGNERRVHLL